MADNNCWDWINEYKNRGRYEQQQGCNECVGHRILRYYDAMACVECGWGGCSCLDYGTHCCCQHVMEAYEAMEKEIEKQRIKNNRRNIKRRERRKRQALRIKSEIIDTSTI